MARTLRTQPTAVSHTPIRAGTLLSWNECPVAVLADPYWDSDEGAWCARCCYVRLTTKPNNEPWTTEPWQVLPRFRVHEKPLWQGDPLTDDEEAKLMALILAGARA